MIPISVSPFTVLPENDFESTLKQLKKTGVDGIEVALLDDISPNPLEETLKTYGFDLTTLAGQSALNPVDPPCLSDEETHEEAIKNGIDLVEAAGSLDCDHVVVTLGGDRNDEPRQRQLERVANGLNEIGTAGEQVGVDVLVEPHNKVDYPNYIINTYSAGKRLVNSIDSTRVGLLFDTYHVQRGEGNVITTYETCKSDVGHLHLANVPGRISPIQGELDVTFVLSELLNRGYQGTIGLEYSPQPKSDPVARLRKSVRMIEQVQAGI